MTYDLGDAVALSVEIRDSSGVLANTTTVVCTITLPDRSTTTPTVTNSSTGVYSTTYTPATVGRYTVAWRGTGTIVAAYDDVFIVTGSPSLPLVSLADLKAHLNITSTSNDEELRRHLLAASDLAERVTDRTFRVRSFTETHDGGSNALVLRHAPVVSITSVTESGAALTSDGWTLNADAGVLRRGSSNSPFTWFGGQDNITVTYVAGEADPPPVAIELVLELARHMWRTQRGAMPSAPGMGGGDDFVPGAAYAMTYRARELADALRLPAV